MEMVFASSFMGNLKVNIFDLMPNRQNNQGEIDKDIKRNHGVSSVPINVSGTCFISCFENSKRVHRNSHNDKYTDECKCV